MQLRGLAKCVVDAAWLDPCKAVGGVELINCGDVLRGVDDHRHVGGLAGETGPAAAGGDRRAVVAASGNRSSDVVPLPWLYDAEGWHAKVRSIRGPTGTRAGIE